MLNKIRFPFFLQHDKMDCGPTCLRMIAKYYGKNYTPQYLNVLSALNKDGVSFLGLSKAAEALGFNTLSIKTFFENLREDIKLPCIAHWSQHHFIVIHKINHKRVYVADPARGPISYTKDEFLKQWAVSSKNNGALLVLEATDKFYSKKDEEGKTKEGWRFLFDYASSYKTFAVQLIAGMLLGSILQLLFPILTQSLVDVGINNHDIGFVYAILLGQLMLFLGQTSVNIIRSWILLYMGTRINITIISDFLYKLMKLPISFFETRMIGDILQRIFDNKRIENFLTNSILSVLFSFINLIVFSIVLAVYSLTIFSVFLAGSVFSAFWLAIFLKKRREIDYNLFGTYSENHSKIVQLISGIREIKLNNNEDQKRWEWEHTQAKLFKVQMKSLSFNQYQHSGTLFLTQLKNIIITFLAAKGVIDGDITLGMMLAITYIIGQLNAPIDQFINFIQSTQDAKLSMERLQEIHNEKEEDSEGAKLTLFDRKENIHIKNLSFQYKGSDSTLVLKDLNFIIHKGKITAIVGESGSGKTTLIKLLLKFYEPIDGEIKIGSVKLKNIDSRIWRQSCGVVMQDGYVFSDTVSNNISMNIEHVDRDRLFHAAKIANMHDFFISLPFGYETKIGSDEHGLSQGQKQRLLIARAVYKNPEYLFFDEATNALDATNESIIMKNLEKFFEGKTAVIVAHRLSTVKNADNIIVIDKGKIIEEGRHEELVCLKGAYYNLIKNQLELGG